jgi:hypothetical protein
MNDTIVQDVREARAAFAERFGYDRARIIAWAREQTKARKAAIEQTKGEQPGTGQPATRPVDEPKGGDKPQPEAEGRSR